MVIHYICRGNAFRSIIAEAYTNSLRLKNVEVLSSGSVADEHRLKNQACFQDTLELLGSHRIAEFAKANYGDTLSQSRLNGADVVVCMNQVVLTESRLVCQLPPGTIVWDVADLGEDGNVVKTKQENKLFEEAVYEEIVGNVNKLLAELALR